VVKKFDFALRAIVQKWQNMFYPGGAYNTDDKGCHDQANANEEKPKR